MIGSAEMEVDGVTGDGERIPVPRHPAATRERSPSKCPAARL
jgi:hypothetical protein